jgi:uncharacterized protein YrrD
MYIKEDAAVYTIDEEQIGQVNRVVIDPRSGEVTHLIIRKGTFFTEDKVIPVDFVKDTSEDRVELVKTKDDLGELPDFEEIHYVSPDQSELSRTGFRETQARPYYWYPAQGQFGWHHPYPAYPSHAYVPYEMYDSTHVERNIPEDTIPLKEGAPVYDAENDHIGDIESLRLDPESNRVTHILISKGLLSKTRKLVPTMWIQYVDEDRVTLVVGSHFIGSLPDYQE